MVVHNCMTGAGGSIDWAGIFKNYGCVFLRGKAYGNHVPTPLFKMTLFAMSSSVSIMHLPPGQSD